MSVTKPSVATTYAKFAEREKSLSPTVYSSISPIFTNLPLDILSLVLEASVYLSVPGDNDQNRRQTAYAYCFISKDVKVWIEPILYERILLKSSKQVESFLRTLELKAIGFLSRAVKAVWVLDETFPINITFKFEQLFRKYRSMTSLVCHGSSMGILQTIPLPTDGPYELRDLRIIKPSSAHYLHIHNLHLQTLHILDYDGRFLGSLNAMAGKDKKLLSALRATRQVFLDSLSMPDNYLTWELRHGLIPLLLLKSPGSEKKICIRAWWCRKRKKRLPDRYNAKDAGVWVAAFDAFAEQCGHRLFVTVESPSEAESELVDAELDLNELKLRIGSE